jgi:peptidoglycan/xylan/chitin deacetylase (PgdA/CDA1 family)
MSSVLLRCWFCLVLGAAVLQGCVEAPPRIEGMPSPAGAGSSAVLARDDDFVLVQAAPGDTAALLAERFLGDRGKGFWIAEQNGRDSFEPGQVVVVPLRATNPGGVQADGYQAIPILCYHRFGPRASPLTVTAATFEAQMDWLARNGYTAITLTPLAAFLGGAEPLPKRSVVITIDDGYRSTWEVAYPILRRYGFPATLFLYSDFVGARDALSWAQMKDMQASGLIDIQPHSKTHANLALRLAGETDSQYRDRIRREVEAPVNALRDRLAVASTTFAYPYGDVNDVVIGELQRRSVVQGVTVTSGGNGSFAHPFLLRRSMVFGTDSLDAFRAKLVTFVPAGSR